MCYEENIDKKLKTHKDLDAWKQSLDLVEMVYKVTKEFPQEELYGLTNQLRRAVVSISSNIAEGAARNSAKESIQFLHIALGSAPELETQLTIAKRLGYLDNLDVSPPTDHPSPIKLKGGAHADN